jgi:hypothetical protein
MADAHVFDTYVWLIVMVDPLTLTSVRGTLSTFMPRTVASERETSEEPVNCTEKSVQVSITTGNNIRTARASVNL